MLKRFFITVAGALLAYMPLAATTAQAASEALPEVQVEGRNFIKVNVAEDVGSQQANDQDDDAQIVESEPTDD